MGATTVFFGLSYSYHNVHFVLLELYINGALSGERSVLCYVYLTGLFGVKSIK